ncbi:MAG: hypothetical protein LLF82_000294 [Dehalococcoides mccartyi]|uniref:DUF1937 family protein n=1 Tax=Dehalococcoides mccartyi TaxID=61435 RepID=UPI002432D627|nr:DUF1937 family protein [Dehalococcoides mccartyi]MCF7634828.1 hypothetical protein [Dehalococcoides mccartyi]
MRVIYVAGKYRAETKEGIEANIQKARHAAIKLWQLGWAVICPHLNTAHFDGEAPDSVWLKGDLEILSRCDAIYMLEGWEQSTGAKSEHELARSIGKAILYDVLLPPEYVYPSGIKLELVNDREGDEMNNTKETNKPKMDYQEWKLALIEALNKDDRVSDGIKVDETLSVIAGNYKESYNDGDTPEWAWEVSYEALPCFAEPE